VRVMIAFKCVRYEMVAEKKYYDDTVGEAGECKTKNNMVVMQVEGARRRPTGERWDGGSEP